MNIPLDSVISDTGGLSAQTIIRAVLKGERDPLKLANLQGQTGAGEPGGRGCAGKETALARLTSTAAKLVPAYKSIFGTPPARRGGIHLYSQSCFWRAISS